ncbi:Uncharacterised protein [Neisseria animalis]|nr:Uncharacterised protein [Neisseria animalis]
MIQRCFALPYYVYCLRLRCLVLFLFYSTINMKTDKRLDCVYPFFICGLSVYRFAPAA